MTLFALAVVAGFLVGRPRVEAFLLQRLQSAAAARGWVATASAVRLTPRLTLELHDLVIEDPATWRATVARASVHPRLTRRGLMGRSALVRLSDASIALPAGWRVAVSPSAWRASSFDHAAHLELAERDGSLDIHVSTKGTDLHVQAQAAKAPLSALVRVHRNGCPIATLGTVDGQAQFHRHGRDRFEVRAKGKARGFGLSPLAAEGTSCEASIAQATDGEAELQAVVEPGAGRIEVSRVRLATKGIEASARFSLAGGLADPQVTLDLEVPRLDVAEVLAAAGLDLPGRDLGVATLSFHTDGRLRDPSSVTATQRLEFTPPAKPLPAISRLKGDFVHQVETDRGAQRKILVSAQSPDFIALADVPPLFVRALLLAEDTNYYGHPGLDLAELPAALGANLERGGFVRGGSTIPQQLAKNLFLTRRKTIGRKVEEAALALLLDATLGKGRMLEIYLNVIEWGPGIYGLRPAARHYFDREPSQLTPRQIVFLVSLVPGPIKYQRSFASGTPTPFFEGLMVALLGKLRAVQALTEEEYRAALGSGLELPLSSSSGPERAR